MKSGDSLSKRRRSRPVGNGPKSALALALALLFSVNCNSGPAKDERPPQNGLSSPRYIGKSYVASEDSESEQSRGSVEMFVGYVDVGSEYTVFEECGSDVELKLSVVKGDAADKVVRQRLAELGRVEGIFLGGGKGRIVSGKRGVEGPFVTRGRVEFTSFSLKDRCP